MNSHLVCWSCSRLVQWTTRLRDNLTIRLLDERGVSYIIAALFIGLVLGPILAFGIEIGRYAETRTLIQQAADLGALAAAQEADVTAFQESGVQQLLTSRAQGVAQDYLNRNLVLAPGQHVSAQVRSIEIVDNFATANVDADVSELFPRYIGHVTIQVQGLAEMRFTRDGQSAP